VPGIPPQRDAGRNAAPGVDGLTWRDYEADHQGAVGHALQHRMNAVLKPRRCGTS
jgi:hypothetical protein